MTAFALEATLFVGRRHELGDLRRAVASARLVTLIGIGGSGKTRLARQLVRQVADDHPGGVWEAELADVTDPALVEFAVAAALGMRPQPGERQVPALAQFLDGDPALLLLDNCEHVLAACASLVAALLARCPALTVVATSRQVLGVSGEVVYRVPSLALPGPGASDDEIARSEAVALFLDRARHALPDFALDAGNARVVASLCQALEGIPLALELAAARLRVLTPAAMLDRLGAEPGLLEQDTLGLPDRHRSMQASVAWSHELCSPQEQELWARLSVFAGGFGLAAAEEVCADATLPRTEMLGVLSRLVDKSVVFRNVAEPEPHFRMLEVLRQYGAARLAERGGTTALRDRHLEYVAGMARRLAEHWLGPEQPVLVRRMRLDHPNLQAALEHAVARPSTVGRALAVVTDLEHYWAVTGLLAEARHWVRAACEGGAAGSITTSAALCVASYFASLQMELDDARRDLERAFRLAPAEDSRDRRVLEGRLQFAAGVLAVYGLEPATARDHLQRCIEALGSAGEVALLPGAYVILGVASSAADDHEAAAAAYRSCLQITEPLGERHIRGLALWAMSLDARLAGDLGRATELARTSLTLRWEIGDDAGVALAIESLASVAAASGDAMRAATLLGAAMPLWRRVGLDPMAGAFIAAHREEGERRARQALGDRAYEAGHRRGLAMPVEAAVGYALGMTATAPEDPLASSPLSPREQEVALLLGEGLTNQEIADRLVISVRTAQSHVESILRKLGMSSRAQVTAWVNRLR